MHTQTFVWIRMHIAILLAGTLLSTLHPFQLPYAQMDRESEKQKVISEIQQELRRLSQIEVPRRDAFVQDIVDDLDTFIIKKDLRSALENRLRGFNVELSFNSMEIEELRGMLGSMQKVVGRHKGITKSDSDFWPLIGVCTGAGALALGLVYVIKKNTTSDNDPPQYHHGVLMNSQGYPPHPYSRPISSRGFHPNSKVQTPYMINGQPAVFSPIPGGSQPIIHPTFVRAATPLVPEDMHPFQDRDKVEMDMCQVSRYFKLIVECLQEKEIAFNEELKKVVEREIEQERPDLFKMHREQQLKRAAYEQAQNYASGRQERRFDQRVDQRQLMPEELQAMAHELANLSSNGGYSQYTAAVYERMQQRLEVLAMPPANMTSLTTRLQNDFTSLKALYVDESGHDDKLNTAREAFYMLAGLTQTYARTSMNKENYGFLTRLKKELNAHHQELVGLISHCD